MEEDQKTNAEYLQKIIKQEPEDTSSVYGSWKCPNIFNSELLVNKQQTPFQSIGQEDSGIVHQSQNIELETTVIKEEFILPDISSSISGCFKPDPDFEDPVTSLSPFEDSIKIEPKIGENISTSKLVESDKGKNCVINVRRLCLECGLPFTDPDLTFHVCYPYPCEYCSEKFCMKSLLTKHFSAAHSDVKRFQCELCRKMFKRKSNLKAHMEIHSGDRPYSCEICDQSFKINAYLKIHMRSHTGERPYSCEICNKSFKTNKQMKVHKRNHTKSKLTKSNKKSNHIISNQNSCEMCDKMFETAFQLRAHKLKDH